MKKSKLTMNLISCRSNSISSTNSTGNSPSSGLSGGDSRRHPQIVGGQEAGSLPASSLTASESAEFQECEAILDRGLATFFDVGNPLLMIREKRLYRATHKTFEQYCRDRWNVGRSYACRVMGAAERVNLLPSNESTPRPSNEFQMRLF